MDNPKSLIGIGTIAFIFNVLTLYMGTRPDSIASILMFLTYILTFCIGTLCFSTAIIVLNKRTQNTNRANHRNSTSPNVARFFAITGAYLLRITACLILLLIAIAFYDIPLIPYGNTNQFAKYVIIYSPCWLCIIGIYSLLIAWLTKAINSRETPLDILSIELQATSSKPSDSSKPPAPQHPRYLLITGLLLWLLTLPITTVIQLYFTTPSNQIYHMVFFIFLLATGLLLVMLSLITTLLHKIPQQNSIKLGQILTLTGASTIAIATFACYKALLKLIYATTATPRKTGTSFSKAFYDSLNALTMEYTLLIFTLGCVILLIALWVKAKYSNIPRKKQPL